MKKLSKGNKEILDIIHEQMEAWIEEASEAESRGDKESNDKYTEKWSGALELMIEVMEQLGYKWMPYVMKGKLIPLEDTGNEVEQSL